MEIEVGVSAIGFTSLELQVGVRLPGAGTFTTDYTWRVRNTYTEPPGTIRYYQRQLALGDLFNPFETRYYIPNSEIRARVRATNSVGTTDWAVATYKSDDYLNPLRIGRQN